LPDDQGAASGRKRQQSHRAAGAPDAGTTDSWLFAAGRQATQTTGTSTGPLVGRRGIETGEVRR
jgi:hypothetical protein